MHKNMIYTKREKYALRCKTYIFYLKFLYDEQLTVIFKTCFPEISEKSCLLMKIYLVIVMVVPN